MAKKKSTTRKKAARTTRVSKKQAYSIAVGSSKAPLAIIEDSRGHHSLAIRQRLGMNRETFSRLVPTSTRNLASIEGGKAPSEQVSRSLKELRRVVDALSEVIKQDAVGPWLNQPNDAFEGLKPIEMIERGEVDRIWEMIYFLRSGVSA